MACVLILEETAMKQLIHQAKAFVRDEQGATAMEYALLAAMVAVVIIGSVTAIGTALANTFGSVSTLISGTL
jgi:pilus assembly protein Flp/PilA